MLLIPTRSLENSRFVKSLQNAAIAGRVERDFEVIEEARHSKQAGDREVVLETRRNTHRAARNEKCDFVEVDVFIPANALRNFTRAFCKVDSKDNREIRVKQTAAGARIDDCFKSFGAR